jgi:uncharacterized protein YacL
MKGFWLACLIVLICLLDISFGLFLLTKTKEKFSSIRFLEGFVKMTFYLFVLFIGIILSSKLVVKPLFGIEDLIPKIITIVFVLIEAESIDRKSQKIGNKPILERIRSFVKTVKEFKNYANSFKPK